VAKLRTSSLALVAVPVFAVSIVALPAGCVDRESQRIAKMTAALDADRAVAVTTARAVEREFTQTVELTGVLSVDGEAEVAAEQSGRLTRVLVAEGQSVTAGQVVAVLDVPALRAQERQARAQIATAEAQIARADRTARLTPDRSAAQTRAAEQEARAAEAELSRVRRGARPEEIRQAEADVDVARTNLANAERQLGRREYLGREGVVAGAEVDRARTERNVAVAQLRKAEQALALLRNGPRREEIAAAAARAAQAQENARAARAAARLDATLRDDAVVARTGREAARAQLAQALDALARTVVRAPISGTVLGRPPKAGGFANAGASLFRIVGGQTAFFEADVAQQDVERLRIGTPASVTMDGVVPGEIPARLVSVSPQAERAGRVLRVRLSLRRPATWRPGMYGRAVLTLRRSRGVAVPLAAIDRSDTGTKVARVAENRLRWVPVRISAEQGEWAEVSGIPPGTVVAVAGQSGLEDGTVVSTEIGKPSRGQK